MKKFLILVVLALATFVATAQNFVSRQFLSGWSLMIVTNATINYGDTNVIYALPSNTNLVMSLAVSNKPASFANAGSSTTLSNAMDPSLGWWTNALWYTNSALNNSPQAWVDVAVPCDRNGKVSDNVALTVFLRSTNSAQGTNMITFTLAPVQNAGREVQQQSVIIPSGSVLPGLPGFVTPGTVPNLAGGSTTFVFSVLPSTNSQTFTAIKTNLPTTFLQGVGALRLTSVVSARSANALGGSMFIDSITLDGFQP